MIDQKICHILIFASQISLNQELDLSKHKSENERLKKELKAETREKVYATLNKFMLDLFIQLFVCHTSERDSSQCNKHFEFRKTSETKQVI